MMKYICLSLSFALGLYACSSDDGKKSAVVKTDFDVFCEQFTALTESPDFSSLSGEDREAKLDAMLVETIETTGNAYVAWSAIRSATAVERDYLYKEAAASTGQENWECPAIEQHGHEVGYTDI